MTPVQLVTVKNETKSIIGFKTPDGRDLTLPPGASTHEKSAFDAWAQTFLGARMLESGEVVAVLEVKAPATPVGEGLTMVPMSTVDLTGLSLEEARALVKATFDEAALEAWKADKRETRKGVRAAIEAQLKALASAVKSGESDASADDTDAGDEG